MVIGGVHDGIHLKLGQIALVGLYLGVPYLGSYLALRGS